MYRLQWRNEILEEAAYMMNRDPRSIVFNPSISTNTMAKLSKGRVTIRDISIMNSLAFEIIDYYLLFALQMI